MIPYDFFRSVAFADHDFCGWYNFAEVLHQALVAAPQIRRPGSPSRKLISPSDPILTLDILPATLSF